MGFLRDIRLKICGKSEIKQEEDDIIFKGKCISRKYVENKEGKFVEVINGRGKIVYDNHIIYNGDIKNNLFHGFGKLIFYRRIIIEVGKGTLVNQDGSKFSAPIINNHIKSLGKIEIVPYDKSFDDTKYTYIDAEGDAFEYGTDNYFKFEESEYKKYYAKILKKGCDRNNDSDTKLSNDTIGQVWCGNWEKGVFNGNGMFIDNYGTIFIGYWKLDKLDYGICIYKAKSKSGAIRWYRYEGPLHNYNMHGKGILHVITDFPNNYYELTQKQIMKYSKNNKLIYQGNFFNNSYHGFGVFYKMGVIEYSGFWEKGRPDKFGISFNFDGNIKEINKYTKDEIIAVDNKRIIRNIENNKKKLENECFITEIYNTLLNSKHIVNTTAKIPVDTALIAEWGSKDKKVIHVTTPIYSLLNPHNKTVGRLKPIPESKEKSHNVDTSTKVQMICEPTSKKKIPLNPLNPSTIKQHKSFNDKVSKLSGKPVNSSNPLYGKLPKLDNPPPNPTKRPPQKLPSLKSNKEINNLNPLFGIGVPLPPEKSEEIRPVIKIKKQKQKQKQNIKSDVPIEKTNPMSAYWNEKKLKSV